MVGQAKFARGAVSHIMSRFPTTNPGTHLSLKPGLSIEPPPRHRLSLISTNTTSERAFVLFKGTIFGHLIEEATTEHEPGSFLKMVVLVPVVLIR